MVRKNLNVDELYDLSIDKWISNLDLLLEYEDINYRELYEMIYNFCSFCLDSIGRILHKKRCKKCKINKKICSKNANNGIISCFNSICDIAYSPIGNAFLKKRYRRKATYFTKQMIIALEFMKNKPMEKISIK